MVLDLHAISAQAKARGVPLEELLASYKAMGASGVAVAELKLDEMVDQGLALPMRGLELRMALANGSVSLPGFEPQSTSTYLVFFEQPGLVREVYSHLKILLGPQVKLHAERVLELPADLRTLRNLGLGFSSATVRRLSEEGFSIWLRPENRVGLKPSEVEALFQTMTSYPGVEGVIFGGMLNQALGYPEALDSTAEQLRQAGWKLGYIELSSSSQQKGIETLVRKLPDRTVRLMAVSVPHQAKLSPFRVAAMYSLAARERNIRLLYVRPYPEPGGEGVNKELFERLSGDIELAPQSSTFSSVHRQPVWIELVIGLAAGAATWLFLETFFVVPVWFGGLMVAGLPLLNLVAAGAGRGQTWRTLLALGIGCLFPLLAVAVHTPLLEDVGRRRDLMGRMLGCSQLLWGVSAISLAGAAMVAAVLHEPTFWVGLDRFRGVKLLTLGVPLAAALVVVGRPERRQKIRELAEASLRFWHLVVLGFTGLVGLVYMLRTGNQSGGTVTETERTLRVLLDQLMGVRPRFKEFLIAHPGMVCAPAIGWWGYQDWLALGVVIGAVGQAGMIDTFAHLHTPLWVSLIRCLLGLALGWLIGLGGVVVSTLLEKRFGPLETESHPE